jgi:long-chain acyl-CoA synthetase
MVPVPPVHRYEHPDVREAAAVASRTTSSAREVGAAVALKPGTAARARAFVTQRVAAYTYARHVWFVDDLPKGPTGRILKREIRPPGAA